MKNQEVKSYVIRNKKGEFFSGHGLVNSFSIEYPEATIYTSIAAACGHAKDLSRELRKEIEVVENYGLQKEHLEACYINGEYKK